MIKATGKRTEIDGELSTVMYEIGMIVQTVRRQVRLENGQEFVDQFDSEMKYVVDIALKELIREE